MNGKRKIMLKKKKSNKVTKTEKLDIVFLSNNTRVF